MQGIDLKKSWAHASTHAANFARCFGLVDRGDNAQTSRWVVRGRVFLSFKASWPSRQDGVLTCIKLFCRVAASAANTACRADSCTPACKEPNPRNRRAEQLAQAELAGSCAPVQLGSSGLKITCCGVSAGDLPDELRSGPPLQPRLIWWRSAEVRAPGSKGRARIVMPKAK